VARRWTDAVVKAPCCPVAVVATAWRAPGDACESLAHVRDEAERRRKEIAGLKGGVEAEEPRPRASARRAGVPQIGDFL
jgi:hypothetical protein